MRIGSVPYLNGKPLIDGLEDEPSIELVSTVPSSLAAMLAGGEVGAALVSTAACFSNPGLRIVPGICISSTGPVESVRLYLRSDAAAVRSVALDTSSLSSVLLARIILEELWGVRPEFVDSPPDVRSMLESCDAGVLIGDPAMQAATLTNAPYLDLGEEWQKMTGLPFVYAIWAVNPSLVSSGLTSILHRARDRGLSSLPSISRAESERLSLPYEVCFHYLSTVIGYDLTPEHMTGIRVFRDLAEARGIPRAAGELEMYEEGLT